VTKTNIVIPAAGQGSRFTAAGFVDPKPFIWSVKREKRLIEIAIEDSLAALGSDAGKVFVLFRAEHVRRGQDLLGDRAEVIPVGALTTGAASTVQLAEPYLDRDAPVFVVNSDQTYSVRESRFAEVRQCVDVAAIPLCFTAKRNESKWSYYDPATGTIIEKPAVPPKDRMATVGAYWFRRAGEMFDAIQAMKAAQFKVNGEYYFAPCHNFLTSGRIQPVFVDRFMGLGTPEDYTIHEKTRGLGDYDGPPATVEEHRERNRLRQRKYQARRKVGFQPVTED
jgi:dTDP-glucose pyrophosphorylase